MKNHYASVLSGVAVAGVVLTSIFSGKATIKANQILKEKEGLSKKEKIKAVLPAYIPALVAGGITIASIVVSDVVKNNNYNNALGACALTTSTLNAYKGAVDAVLNEEDKEKVIQEVVTSKINSTTAGIEDTGNGDILFIEELTGRQFYSSVEAVQAAEYETNRIFNLSGSAKLNSFYSFLNLRKSDMGSKLVWEAYRMSCDWGASWIDFNHIKMNVNGETCYVITYPVPPEIEEE